MAYRALPELDRCAERLERIFPRSAFDTVLSSPSAGIAVAAMLYVDAVVPDNAPVAEDARWVRPSTIVWLSEVAYARDDPTSRSDYYSAALRSKKRVEELHQSWGEAHMPMYADNSREGPRDEVFPHWIENGAMRKRAGMKTTGSLPRWALCESFADLFDPALQGDALQAAIDAWRDAFMTPGARLKALTAQEREQTQHAVRVTLPNGVVRELEPGDASVILKGVIESWAPARLSDAVVLTVSEPGDKIYIADARVLGQLGLRVDQTTLLPDAVIVDIGQQPPTFWIIEAVATDGPVTERRKSELIDWAKSQRIPDGACQFLSAFASRNSPPARRRLKDLASGTYAWYADEPGAELAWYGL